MHQKCSGSVHKWSSLNKRNKNTLLQHHVMRCVGSDTYPFPPAWRKYHAKLHFKTWHFIVTLLISKGTYQAERNLRCFEGLLLSSGKCSLNGKRCTQSNTFFFFRICSPARSCALPAGCSGGSSRPVVKMSQSRVLPSMYLC